ncbi:PGF-CTERM sorting domain-containing protein [Methanolobus mangrovi]|uniref:PGF-CTERM sorting domain-containing protein n=1 Tax=Methanolobus mangrovi TaxID=3072977 RepID=A0AA51UGW9_9EURY|nr:PGF-CTERM sorting domain-containing protein [Methanolobus mangrovi]WMW22971.1 PGF-CTERM sorting domain-containing protein [Methanolobus mangrovi]
MKYKLILVLFLAVILLVGAPMTSAKSSFLSSFNNYYDTGDTRLDSCVICHTGPNGGSLNSYGRASGGNFVSIEDRDSDGDGFSNIDEINALTFPGDANDFPEPVPELISEPIDNVTEAPVEEMIDNQSIEEPIVNETQEETTTEEQSEETTTEQQSPGFEVILAIAGILSVVYLKRK